MFASATLFSLYGDYRVNKRDANKRLRRFWTTRASCGDRRLGAGCLRVYLASIVQPSHILSSSVNAPFWLGEFFGDYRAADVCRVGQIGRRSTLPRIPGGYSLEDLNRALVFLSHPTFPQAMLQRTPPKQRFWQSTAPSKRVNKVRRRSSRTK